MLVLVLDLVGSALQNEPDFAPNKFVGAARPEWEGYISFAFCTLAGTAENSGISPSAMVGCVKIASRNAV